MGSGCGSVGRQVFPINKAHSSNLVIRYFITNIFTFNSIEKTKIKKKRPEVDNLKKYQTLQLIVGPLEIQAS